MIITNCPRCGAMNATTTCTKCGWSQFTKSTVSTRITGEIEIMLSGKALLDDYKRLLLENRNLKERVAELEAAQARWVMASERLPEENQQILSTDGKEFYLDYYARWEGKDNPPCFCDGLSWAVTHWMPLPEYPNDTQKETFVYGKERER